MLHELAKNGSFSQLSDFLTKHPTYSDEEMANALAAAAFRGDREIVKLLLDAGADPNCLPTEHLPPIHCAVEQEALDVVRLLVEYGARVDLISDGFTPLHAAIDVEGDGALQAEATPTSELTALLLELGADVSIKDNKGRTPLDFAERYGHTAAIALIQAASRK